MVCASNRPPLMGCCQTCPPMECFHMTSRRPYWCPKTMKRRPCWCPKPVLWELNSFLMQTLSFVPINLHILWPREWKHSISKRRDARYSTNLTTVGSDWVSDVTYKFVSWVATKKQQINGGRKSNRKFQGFLMGIEMRRITESLFKTQPLQQKLFWIIFLF